MPGELLPYINTLNARRKRQRQWGWGLMAFGILTYIDGAAGMSLPPIWLTGIWAFLIGTPILIAGVLVLFASYQLPIREALMFASLHDGKITVPALSLSLDVTLDTAEAIVMHLRQRGYAQVSSAEMEDGVIVYQVSGVARLSAGDCAQL